MSAVTPDVDDPRVERTREVVHAAVRDLLRAEGRHAVTPQRLASDTGVSRSTIHRHWPDLRQLLLDAIHEPEHVADTPLLGDLRTDLAVDLHGLRLRLNDRETVAVIVSMIGESVFDEGFATTLRAHAEVHFDRLRRVIAAAQEAATLGPDIDAEAVAAMLAGPLFFRRLVLGELITPEFVDAVVDAFIASHEPR